MIRSFDIFDTLLTRTVALPRDLFLIVGANLLNLGLMRESAESFSAKRIAAEGLARARGNECTLKEIYDCLAKSLNWDAKLTDQAMSVELEQESACLRAVPAMRMAVLEARQQAGKVLFLSDMYLPSSFLIEVLRREGFYQEGDEVWVSGELRASKATGKLFSLVAQKKGAVSDWRHQGDNLNADVRVPRQFSISSVHVSEATLNRYEQMARGEETTGPLWRSQLAGAMRMARLQKSSDDPHLKVLWDTACDVAGPLLFGFVHWCLEQAAVQGWKRLYFVSRDGQILLRIARQIQQAWEYPVECRYLYGSRRAWRPAVAWELKDADLEWISPQNGHLTLRQILARMNLMPEQAATALSDAGWSINDWDGQLPESQNVAFRKMLVREPMRGLVENVGRQTAALALKYLRQEGLLDSGVFAIVDIGWYGNLQRTLVRLLGTEPPAGNKTLCGLYLGLFPKSKIAGQMWDYWSQLKGFGGQIEAQEATMLEMFAVADHPTVVGYRQGSSGVEPILEGGGKDELLGWGLPTWQSGITEFARQFVNLCQRQQCPLVDFQSVARRIYERFYIYPAAIEAAAWRSCQLLDPVIEKPAGSPVPVWTARETIHALCDIGKRPAAWWPQGALALQPNWILSLFLTARRLRRGLRACFAGRN